MRLPEDIIRLIVECAFDVGALDTCVGCTKPATRMSTAFALEGLEGTARALCLVSRLFYRLCIPRFFEVVAVHDHRLAPSVAASLRVPPAFIERPRGSYCRRLDIDTCIYLCSDWSHGAATLWGLILACPRLEILNVNVVSGPEKLPWESCLCPVSLLIQIADAYGPRLLRFELRGVINVHFSGIRYLASKCPRLEILCVPRMFAVYDGYESEYDDVEDDIDQTEGRIVLPRAMVDQMTPLMSAEEQQVFARTHAAALDAARSAPARVDLPRVHTLEVGNYIDFTRHWTFLRLRVLHSSFLVYGESSMDHNLCLSAQTSALERLGASLLAWTVTLSEDVDAWAQLGALPNLQYIGFVLDGYEDPPEHLPHCGHPALQEVDLVVPYIVHLTEPWAWLSFLHTLAEDAKLPALRTVRIVATYLMEEWERDLAKWRTAFARLRVRLEFAPGYLTPSPTMFHVPILDRTHFYNPKWAEGRDNMVDLYSRVYPDVVRRLCRKSGVLYRRPAVCEFKVKGSGTW